MVVVVVEMVVPWHVGGTSMGRACEVLAMVLVVVKVECGHGM